MSETEKDKMTRQKYKERCIFKMTGKTGSSNWSSSTVHSHSDRLIQPNKSEVLAYCNSSAVNKVFDHAKLKESVHR